MKDNLINNILPFWLDKLQNTGNIETVVPQGAVLQARMLWSFSAAYNHLQDPQYLTAATNCYNYLIENFYDPKHSGVYWSLNADGSPLDSKKQFYALGFAIYGLSEYFKASNNEKALEYAIELFLAIEAHSLNREAGGYIEATTKDWKPIADLRLSEKDANQPLTMNTHLHILEPYTNLYRVWQSPLVKKRIIALLDIFCDKIYDPTTNHLGLFFDLNWQSMDKGYSYGHDIEASWLMLEAALVIEDEEVLAKVKPIAYKIAMASLEGLQEDGSMIYERSESGHLDCERHWWVQAETVVGLMWLQKYHNFEKGEEMALKCWDYIKNNIVDNEGGEWWWSRLPDGTINTAQEKAGFWKCPYHNSRMCLEYLTIKNQK